MAVFLGVLIGIVILVWQYIAIKKIKNWYLAGVLPLILMGIVVAVAFHDHEPVDYTVLLGILAISFGPYIPLQAILW
ncbi:hypothetical protein [Periweissella ghanensis]|uniref:Uncharacterized protein n=1 Tax=Periweissella ghanensis TaxID=467997 RepID=A0ABM8ZAU1_9LACO|nr:hypothetical protein [Periweissella ghanensis]MCM0601204.1 hypothetical protein [Periweissella ghanensis]CAH0418004.1 hypothetical protein WGH24286_00420 [Periweissella ghanensis]